ncbi:MAG TPA: hypothetical protein VM370_08575 [Candidatus Thermoplasmatota archaeon]|nr:hypothetical protein [Candidatus Thermoplasmatota archaeon]
MTAPDLMFFRELRVSDPVLKDDASTSTYTFVDKRGRKHPLTLHYKFPAPLYADANAAMVNQARVHHAIPSLNYGLFCKRIVFEFPLTKADLAYLTQMQGLTAREIYLNRFVGDEPHPLVEAEYHVPTARFDPRALKRLARMVCKVEPEPARDPHGEMPDSRRYAVLSSGGKESLLTYGILRELNEDVSPIYVNESGRHWYTALMAHRYHAKTDERTKRIWTSVDRLYVGANRLLPCIKKNFQSLGADVYPTQLFTFNSYQMAVAGLAMHFGIGTLLMGNEFDEGDWPEEKGVKHWWGIYDQSQEFDDVLNAYYEKKGWGIRQASILRTLSGLIIQDALASRYPDLLAVQTSCHATHLRGTKVIPCGRCSKCQGIILFLLAAGHDPKKLRYTAADIRALADALATTHVKFERPEAEHCMWLAQKRGWTFKGSANGFVPRPHPEVQSLRFHPETSPRRAMPKELADRVYAILSTKAKGAREKVGERWIEAAP